MSPPHRPRRIDTLAKRVVREIDALGNAVDATAEDEPDARLAATYALLDRTAEPDREPGATQRLADVRDRLGAILAKRVPYRRTLTFDGLGVLGATKKGKTYDWDGTRIAAVVAAQVADEVVDPATGEVPPVGAIAHAAAMAVVECAGLDAPSKSWRSTSLGQRGIEADDYRAEKASGRLGVKWED